ncbi:FAD-dependent oxidoreductase [Clostridium polynesiense]|uniref:FAD-dependent oxidoreductase n=1 Tax=Clostridium polynesiense TaxID=1325933 RepID=UPI00058D579C|nr:FAD-dependent oxidoreductase [Clostridium polynesiense]
MSQFYDIIIIGGGPAGLSAALYAARAKNSVLVLEKESIGGQIAITSEVVNYPGIEKTSGKAMTEEMRKQAMNFGAEFLFAEVKEVDFKGDYKSIKTSKGEFESLGVVIATGANPRKLGFPGEKEFEGRGVAYCATCDGEFFTGLDIFVVGAGFAAAEEAMFLTRFARKVKIIAREPEFTCAKSIGDKVKANPGIEIYFNTEVQEVGGSSKLEYAKFINNQTGETWEYRPENPGESFGVFIFAGYIPASSLVKGHVALDNWGYIITDENQRTDVEGVYAAGDICIKNLRQVVTAVSDGATAATALEKYIADKYEELGLEKKEVEVKRPEDDPDLIAQANTEVSSPEGEDGSFITSAMAEQLKPIFDKFQSSVKITAILDERDASKELQSFLKEVEGLSHKVSCRLINKDDKEAEEFKEIVSYYPSVLISSDKDEYLGVQFHGVPGGHEFNSFIIALYNAAGPGQAIDEETRKNIESIDKPINMKVFVSLSCTMCPEVVMASQKIALENKNVEAEMFDLSLYPDFKEKYDIMSVPCMVLNDKDVTFGKKNIDQILSFIGENH